MKKVGKVLSVIGDKKRKNKEKAKKKKKKRHKNQRANQSERGVRKTKSLDSVFNVSNRKHSSEENIGSRLNPINGRPLGSIIFDSCAYVVLCQKHKTIALCKQRMSSVVWLPFIYLPTSRTWDDGAHDGAYIVLSNGDATTYVKLRKSRVFNDGRCLQMFRIQLPQTQHFITRLIYLIRLDPNYNELKCCVDNKRIVWLPLQDVVDGKVANTWGPELIEFIRMTNNPIIEEPILLEYSLDEAFYYVPRDPPRNLEEEMLKSTNFTEKDIERLYTDFLEHCFPSFFMTLTSFCEYMTKYGFEKNDKKLENLFNAFNYKNNSFLSFHELLLGLTSIDPASQNGQSRIKFVFKYFDANHDGFLSVKEFRQMIREIHPNISEKQVKSRAKEGIKAIGIHKEGISFDDFFKAVGAHKFRGTSNLCRSNYPILQQISRSMAARTLKRSTGISRMGTIFEKYRHNGICGGCRRKSYDYANHTIRLGLDGRVDDIKILPELNYIKRNTKEEPNKQITRTQSSQSVANFTKDKFSTEFVFNPKSVANYLLEQIRTFNLNKGSHKDNIGLLNGDKTQLETFVKKLEKLCHEVEKIVEQEDRCVKLSSPAFLIGDIHGNLEDLMTMERVLWRSVPILSAHYVFLGDYVDRGKWGLECTAYLFALKMLNPNKIVILRGNHEDRGLQTRYTYKKECINKYKEFGLKIWEITNRVFDRLPVCAVIDDAIFCAHGGIPCSTKDIDKINEVKIDLRDPEKESAIAWEIMWSDPIGPQKFAETAELLQIRAESSKGYLPNVKRGTAFLFNEEAANNFLLYNGLTHIVRAHEVPFNGFTFHFGKKCTTVFSCSHYCGNNNEAACVHVDGEKLRIVRLDTVNNAPASD